MAGKETDKQLLSFIREFATENSQGERRIDNLKKQIEQLKSAVSIEILKLDEAKRQKETIEQELKGYEVEMTMIETSILALEARICSAQGEISVVQRDLEFLKNEEGAIRDDFIKKMFALNQEIRFFQASVASALKEDYNQIESRNGVSEDVNTNDAETCIRDIENELAMISSQINLVTHEYEDEQKVHKLVQQELSDLESKALLIEKIMNESREIQDLTRQIPELEEKCASFIEQLKRRSSCPRCHKDNSQLLGVIPKQSEFSTCKSVMS